MNTMSHRGYTARIEFDERDNIFVGRVLGLHTMNSFHGETVAELRSEFETAIRRVLARLQGARCSPRETCVWQAYAESAT